MDAGGGDAYAQLPECWRYYPQLFSGVWVPLEEEK